MHKLFNTLNHGAKCDMALTFTWFLMYNTLNEICVIKSVTGWWTQSFNLYFSCRKFTVLSSTAKQPTTA